MSPPKTHVTTKRPARWWTGLLVIVLLCALLANLPGRASIPPLIESDYAYLLIAADRLYEGSGLTAPVPVAPFQPWTWQADWAFLTRWPIGYPLMVCGIRHLLEVGTTQACAWISVVACAAALAGWFTWVKQSLPRGVAGTLLASVAAGCSVSAAFLINPSTDLILVAALPFVLLAVVAADTHGRERHSSLYLGLAGLAAGALFWIRYAAIFVALGVAAYLCIRWCRRKHGALRLAVFSICAAAPVVGLLLVNRTFGTLTPMHTQLNLGHKAGFDFAWQHLATAWWKFTDLGFYDYHWYSRWVYALWPAGLVLFTIMIRRTRRAMAAFFAAPHALLSGTVVFNLLCMLIGTTTVFGDKFNYVDLDRYYAPVKPLYFVLFVAPLALIPIRVVRMALCVVLVVAGFWISGEEWSKPYKRWLAAGREVTPYGQWGRCFSPRAAELYKWLSAQKADDVVVVSNFHDYIALETKIPAVPVPEDTVTLDTWLERISAARGLENTRVLFILDRDPRWRSYFLKPATEIIEAFRLRECAGVPRAISAGVYEYGGMLARGNVDP